MQKLGVILKPSSAKAGGLPAPSADGDSRKRKALAAVTIDSSVKPATESSGSVSRKRRTVTLEAKDEDRDVVECKLLFLKNTPSKERQTRTVRTKDISTAALKTYQDLRPVPQGAPGLWA